MVVNSYHHPSKNCTSVLDIYTFWHLPVNPWNGIGTSSLAYNTIDSVFFAEIGMDYAAITCKLDYNLVQLSHNEG